MGFKTIKLKVSDELYNLIEKHRQRLIDSFTMQNKEIIHKKYNINAYCLHFIEKQIMFFEKKTLEAENQKAQS
jgi:hypothetical protein